MKKETYVTEHSGRCGGFLREFVVTLRLAQRRQVRFFRNQVRNN